MTTEIEDLETEIAALTRELNESPAAAQEDMIAKKLHRLTERLRALRERSA